MMSGGGGEAEMEGVVVRVDSGRKWEKMGLKVTGWRMPKEEMKKRNLCLWITDESSVTLLPREDFYRKDMNENILFSAFPINYLDCGSLSQRNLSCHSFIMNRKYFYTSHNLKRSPTLCFAPLLQQSISITLYFDSPSVDSLQGISSMSAVYQLTFNNTVSTDK